MDLTIRDFWQTPAGLRWGQNLNWSSTVKSLTLFRTYLAIRFLERYCQNGHSLQVWSLSEALPSFATSLNFHLRFLLLFFSAINSVIVFYYFWICRSRTSNQNWAVNKNNNFFNFSIQFRCQSMSWIFGRQWTRLEMCN